MPDAKPVADGTAETDPHRARTRGARRERGAFFTPPPLALALVRWAAPAGGGRLLDPSCGDGAFLSATVAVGRERLVELVPVGVEMDAPTVSLAQERVHDAPQGWEVYTGDFFGLDSTALGTFPAIVGNPPYIRHHTLSNHVREAAHRRITESRTKLSDQADVWALFVVHAMSLLAHDGRLALVLPGSALQADYARPVFDALRALGRAAQLIRIQELIFEGARERSVILTLDLASEGTLTYAEVADVNELSRLLNGDDRPSVRGFRDDRETRTLDGLPQSVITAWSRARSKTSVVALGAVSKTRIGVVTGANSFFIRSDEEIEELLAGQSGTDDLARNRSIVARSAWLTGLAWTEAHAKSVVKLPSRLLALPGDLDPVGKLLVAINEAERDELDRRSHCAKRKPWWSILDVEAPNMFLPYMGGSPPGLFVNEANSLCTNAIHRVWLTAENADPYVIALSSRTALYRLGAEVAGRQYGGGVLKFEMADVARLVVVTSVGNDALRSRVHESAMLSDANELALAADQLILREHLGLSDRTIRELRAGAELLRERRTQNRQKR